LKELVEVNKRGMVLSKEKRINKIFVQIAGIPDPETRIAIPGTGIAEPEKHLLR